MSSPSLPSSSLSKKRIKYHHVAHNLALLSGFLSIFTGSSSILYSSDYNIRLADYKRISSISLFTILSGLSICVYELSIFGKYRSGYYIPLRGIVYIMIGVIQCIAENTIITGIFCIITGIINLIAHYKNEILIINYNDDYLVGITDYLRDYKLFNWYFMESSQNDKKEKELLTDKIVNRPQDFGVMRYINILREENKLVKYIIYFIYAIFNSACFAVGYTTTVAAFNNNQLIGLDSAWLPIAKGFGYMLNLNCSMIVVPMLRVCLKLIYNATSDNNSWISNKVRSFVLLFPVDLSLQLHYMVAFYIALASIGHGFSHLINLTLNRDTTLNTFGYWVVVTGFLLCFICFIIYATSFDNVKKSKYEFFRYSHHLSIVFFILNIVHGKNYLGPQFWKWFVFPGGLYFLERLYMWYQSSKEAKLLSATFMQPRVISLEFEKYGAFAADFQEGMYCLLKCPTVSGNEMHPFTISSAPCEKTITFHILIHGQNSWTKKMYDYISMMMAQNESYVQFSSLIASGNVPGKTIGPDGKPLFIVYGPHAAPFQHAKFYGVSLLIAGGIGCTPMASFLKQYVYNLQQKQNIPRHCYMNWMVRFDLLDSFRWFIRCLKECDDELHLIKDRGNVSFHVYVTSLPSMSNVNFDLQELSHNNDFSNWGNHLSICTENSLSLCGYTEVDLYRSLKTPIKGNTVKLGFITIHYERPIVLELLFLNFYLVG